MFFAVLFSTVLCTVSELSLRGNECIIAELQALNADPYAGPHLNKGHHMQRTHIEPFLGPHLRKGHHTGRTNTTPFVKAHVSKDIERFFEEQVQRDDIQIGS